MVVLFTLVLFQLLVVGWIDFKTKKISNRWVLFNLVWALGLYLGWNGLYPFNWEIFIFPVSFVFIGFFLYLIKIMGAGDSKYLASLFLIVPLEFHMLFFEKLLIATICTGAILLTYRILKNGAKLKAYLINHYWEGIRLTLQSRFSYAPVIFLAWVMLGFDIWR